MPGKTLRSQAGEELHERPRAKARVATEPFVANYLPALLAQVHSLIAGDFHAIAAEHGCAPTEWRVLATLAEGEPVSIGRLADIVVMKQPTLTRVLDRLVATGQVQRVRHAGDRRIILVNITAAGRRVADTLVPLARAHEERMLAAIGPRRAAAVKSSLERLIGMRRDESPAAADI